MDGSPRVDDLIDEMIVDAMVYLAEGVDNGVIEPAFDAKWRDAKWRDAMTAAEQQPGSHPDTSEGTDQESP